VNVITQFPPAPDYPRHLRFEAMFEGAAIGIGICELNGWILEANPALSQMLGYSQQELTGAHAGELYPEICRRPHPDTAYTGNLEPGNLDARNRSLDERLLGELMRGERSWFEIEKRYRRKDGSELCGHLTVSLWCDARSQPAFLIAMLADATERRRVEALLRQAEKMEVIGRLAGGIAHDFNNLLTGILLYCDLLSAGLSGAGPESGGGESGCRENNGSLRIEPPEGHGMGTSELCQHVEEVRVAGQQGAALTQQLLAIARQQPAELRPVPINEIVVSTENLLRRLIGERIELITALDSGAGVVLVDPAQLRQVLLNLVLNARDALPMGGKIRLITRSAEFPGMESPGAKCAI
jgi:two-component system cell cycle sensor histidine kinase/response regulator CckA